MKALSIRKSVAAICVTACLVSSAMAQSPGFGNGQFDLGSNSTRKSNTVTIADLDQMMTGFGYTVRHPQPKFGFATFERNGVRFDIGYFVSDDGRTVVLGQNLVRVPSGAAEYAERVVNVLNGDPKNGSTKFILIPSSNALSVITVVSAEGLTSQSLQATLQQMTTTILQTRTTWESVAKATPTATDVPAVPTPPAAPSAPSAPYAPPTQTTSIEPSPTAPVVPVNQIWTGFPRPVGTQNRDERAVAQAFNASIARIGQRMEKSGHDFGSVVVAAIRSGRVNMRAIRIAYDQTFESYASAERELSVLEVPSSPEARRYYELYRQYIAVERTKLQPVLQRIVVLMQMIYDAQGDSTVVSRAAAEINSLLVQAKADLAPLEKELMSSRAAMLDRYGLPTV